MTALGDFGLWSVAVFLLCLTLLVFHRPLARILRLAFRCGVGLAGLALFSPFGSFLGISVGVNWVNALVLGLLGVPGFGLLMMLQWVLR